MIIRGEDWMKSCPICGENIQYDSLGSRDAYSINCPRCGNYHLTRTVWTNLRNTLLSHRQRANISGWLSENQGYEVATNNIDWLMKIPTPSFHEKADKILLGLEKKTNFAGEYLERNISWIGLGWCINQEELSEVLEYLESTNRIHKQINPSNKKFIYKIIPDGWAHLETQKKIGADSKQCFVAMWFDDQMQSVYNQSIAKGIMDAGYEPHRVDEREYNGKIDDEIIAQIRRSRFIVADFTGHRGGVYYEAGFAQGLNLEVIFTCKKDKMKEMHFDTRQYNCIDWEEGKLEDFKIRLTNRIERIFGHGTYQT